MNAGQPQATAGRTAALGWLATAVLILLLCSSPRRLPAALAADAPAREFSAERALAALGRVLGPQLPHPGGTPEHSELRERLVRELRSAGVEPRVDEALARGPGGNIALVRNVVARIGPAEGPSVLLSAHYDSVGASPGAADGGAGLAALIELARALRSEPYAGAVTLLATDGEETGLAGASAFVEAHGQPGAWTAVINLGARGTGGPAVLFETRNATSASVAALAASVEQPFASSLSDLVFKSLPAETDLAVLEQLGVPGFNFALLAERARHQTTSEKLDSLDPRSVQHLGAQALALARELAVRPTSSGRGAAVFFDLAGWSLWHWPEKFGALLAVAVCAAALLRGRRAFLNRSARAAEVVAAFATALAALGFTSAASFALTRGLAQARGMRDPGAVAPLALRIACVGATLACLALAARIPKLRALSFRSYWVALLLGSNLAALALAVALPRASHLALVPAVVALALDVALDPTRRGPLARTSATLLLAALQTLLWTPVAQALELDAGFARGGWIGAAFACSLLPCALLWTQRPRRELAAALLVGLLLAAGGAVNASLRPARSSSAPGWLNLRYVADGAAARLEASTFGAPLPAELAAARPFEPATTPPFPWLSLDRSMWIAGAPAWDVPPPNLEVLETRASAAGRVLRARLSSPRGAPRLHLRLDERARLLAVSAAGHTLRGGFERVRTQLFFAVPPQGLEVEIEVRGAEPTSIHLLDQCWDLPECLAELVRARPVECVPRSDGDVSVLGRAFEL